MKKREAQSHRHVLPKSPHSIQGLGRITGGDCRKAGRPCLRRRWLRKDPLCMEFLVRGQRSTMNRGLHIIRGDRGRTHSKRRFVGFDWTAFVERKKIWLEHITLDGMKSNKVVNTIWKVCLSGLTTQLRASGPNV